jgi:hypothetical protein
MECVDRELNACRKRSSPPDGAYTDAVDDLRSTIVLPPEA